MPRIPHRWQTWACLLTLGVAGFRAVAQETNRQTAVDYAAFKLVADRNIFNASRFPGGSGPTRRAPRIESVSLLGTMSYEKGRFAFFEGTSSEFTKALKPEEMIAGYKVSDIAPSGVKLEAGTNTIDLKVGYQLRREDGGAWLVTMVAESSFQSDRSSGGGGDFGLRTDRGGRDRNNPVSGGGSFNNNRQDRQDRQGQGRRNGFGSQSGGNNDSGSTSSSGAASSGTSGGSGANPNDVLQRLIQQRAAQTGGQ